MVRYLIVSLLVGILILLLVGCAAHVHQVGKGAQGHQVVEARQWYVLWGLVPLNKVDTAQMASNVTDYTIKTEQSALDIVMNLFTGYITVYSRTVTVTK